MGLAASQARLLTITARKSDCEFQSMSLSHQKLALARDMENISTEYQEALNTTKLVYDYYGTGTSDTALTYGLLMTPSIYNDYYPKLVTDSKNRVILNSAYASAARAAGIPAEGLLGTPSSDVRNKFIEALANANIITGAAAASIIGVTYNNQIGNGSTISATTAMTDITYDELLELLKVYGSSTSDCGITLGEAKNLQLTSYVDTNDKTQIVTSGSNERFDVLQADGTYLSYEGSGGSVTLYDLLCSDNQYYISILSEAGVEIPLGEMYYLQNKLCGTTEYDSKSILSWMYEQFSAILGGTSASDTALAYAMNSVYDIIVANDAVSDTFDEYYNKYNKSEDGTKKGDARLDQDEEGIQDAMNENAAFSIQTGTDTSVWNSVGVASGDSLRKFNTKYEQISSDYLGFVYTHDDNASGWSSVTHKDRDDKSQISINLNNLAQAFLTAYVDYMTSFTEGYVYDRGSDYNFYNSALSDFMFSIVSDVEIDDGDSQLYANFYDTLFNRICLQGWTENDQIDDADYLSEMFKNGMAYISSIKSDGYYYQGAYSTDMAVLEVTDDDAIAKAEAKYYAEKAKLENKEDTIDLKMKNLDTEISSLTTEYDTTKTIITKAIEKSFKRYDA